MAVQSFFKGKDVLIFFGAENAQGYYTKTILDAGPGRVVERNVTTGFETPMEIHDVTSLGIDGFGLEFEDIDVLGRPVPINIDIRNNVSATIERQMSGTHKDYFMKAAFLNPLGACNATGYDDKGNSTLKTRGFHDDTYGYWMAARIGILEAPTNAEIWVVFHNCKLEASPTLNAGGTNTESITLAGRYAEVRVVPTNVGDVTPPFDWSVDSEKFAKVADFTGASPTILDNDDQTPDGVRAVGAVMDIGATGVTNETKLKQYIHIYSS